jgi:hypothetical protein
VNEAICSFNRLDVFRNTQLIHGIFLIAHHPVSFHRFTINHYPGTHNRAKKEVVDTTSGIAHEKKDWYYYTLAVLPVYAG